MFVLHTHWQPPRPPNEPGGILFWAETSDTEPPVRHRGTLPKKHKPKDHPFNLAPDALREAIGSGTPLYDARESSALLLLPTTRTGPLPSPNLAHNWELDIETEPFLAPTTVRGLWLPASKAYSVLINLPDDPLVTGFELSHETRYWRLAANLVLETLAAQKIIPVLEQTQTNGRNYYAHWRAVLDGPRDAPRIAALAEAMPPVCRAELRLNTRPQPTADLTTPRAILNSFLDTMCDALARSWGRARAPQFNSLRDNPLLLWLVSLFTEEPVVTASNAQLQALSSGLRAWMRGLNAAGDSVFRIAFRLRAPGPLDGPHESIRSKDWEMEYILQAREDPSLLIPASEVWRTGGTSLTVLGKRFEQPQEKLLAGLGYAARMFSPILPSLQTSTPTGVDLDTQSAYSFLRDAAPLLEEAGFGLIVPPWWDQRGARLGVRLRLEPKKGQSESVVTSGKLGLDALVHYTWELSLGEAKLTREEFESLVALKSPLVQIRGQWVQLDAQQVEAAIAFWERQKQSGDLSLMQAAQYALGGQTEAQGLQVDEVEAEGWVLEWLQRLSEHEKIQELPQPENLRGELRPYQRFGYSWLAFFNRFGLGACLADDMGLGKTIQALALVVREKDKNGSLPAPYLLVCPTSVVSNWEHEVRRFAPTLRTMKHQGAGRLRGEEFTRAAQEVDLVLSSYAVVRQDADFLQPVKWAGVIVDEAQNIKNPSAKQTQAVRKLDAGFRLAMTGTPVENRLSELWSIMNFLNPGYLGSHESFRRTYSLPIERFSDPEATQQLRQLISPFILRRVKTDPRVIQDLPDKIEMKEYCYLTEEQATLYEVVVKDALKRVQESDGMERRGIVLSLLMQLKQVCNHPSQYLHQITGAETDMDQFRGRSGKLTRLTEMLDEVLAVGDRVLVFTQFAEMGRLLAPYLRDTLGYQTLFLHGGTTPKMREQMIRRFEEEEHGPPIFILSLKAGGLGLNLTRANHVFHFDRWWNPAVENQATDRAFRIGQTRNVQVHKFLTTGTLEEKIDEMIESKKGLAEAIVGSGESWLTELSTDELRDLVQLRRS